MKRVILNFHISNFVTELTDLSKVTIQTINIHVQKVHK